MKKKKEESKASGKITQTNNLYCNDVLDVMLCEQHIAHDDNANDSHSNRHSNGIIITTSTTTSTNNNDNNNSNNNNNGNNNGYVPPIVMEILPLQ